MATWDADTQAYIRDLKQALAVTRSYVVARWACDPDAEIREFAREDLRKIDRLLQRHG